MREIVSEDDAVLTREIAEHLRREFGSLLQCPRGCEVYAPPLRMPFEVREPLQTEPHAVEVSRNKMFGLDDQACIPPGIYDGIEMLTKGTSTHRLYISGSEAHGTKRVSIRLVSGNVDWRAVRALKS